MNKELKGRGSMIKSKTKYQITQKEIMQIFEKNNIHNISEIKPLGNGEFNAAYQICTDEGKKSYVLKIAPPKDAKVLTYEHNMMSSEVFWYEKMREGTDILIPQIYASDFSHEIIDASYFIMEMMKGEPLWAVSFTDEEHEAVQSEKINMLTKIHRIHNHQYGYLQTGLYDTWYEAIRAMIQNLIHDCETIGKETPDGKKLLACVDKHKALLEKSPCCMVNFDLWDSNILYQDGKLCWIDPERSYWGDPIADFITLGEGQKTPLSGKQKQIEIYNRTAETPIVYGKEAEIRYQVAVGLLALIEEVEKYVRYEPEETNYIRNTVDARAMYDMAFEILK